MNQPFSSISRFIKPALALVGCGTIILVGVLLYRASQFHIVRTDPKLSAVADTAPTLTVYFNDELQTAGFRSTYDRAVISHYEISKKTLVFHFAGNLKIDKQYSITLNYLQNKAGEELRDKKLVFTAKDIEFDKLSGKEQKKLIAGQDERMYEVSSIAYTNFDELLDYSITAGQLQNIKNLLYDYSNIVGKKYWQMVLDAKSIVVTNHDSDSSDVTDKLDFTVELDGARYHAHAEYEVFYDSVYLQLKDSSGTLVYDSANGAD